MKHSSASAEVRFRFGSILFMEIALFKLSLGYPLFFFLRLASSDRLKFLAFSKQEVTT